MGSKALGWKIAISAMAAVLLAGHLIWPAVKLDGPALFLIALCFLPWLGAIFKSIEFPGGGKVEYREQLLKAAQKLEDVGLLQGTATSDADRLYLSLMGRDTNLALAGLRIDIEKKLRRLAQYLQPSDRPRPLRDVVELIGDNKLFTPSQTEVMHKILKSLNIAVHGGRVPADDAEEVMGRGLRLLSALDKRIDKQKSASGAAQ